MWSNVRLPASAGSAPAASLKPMSSMLVLAGVRGRIRGVCPRGLIEARTDGTYGRRGTRSGIRGVCPRGLIEAADPPAGVGVASGASAGSAPAASLKRSCPGSQRGGRWRIRGVCPRGLIEAVASTRRVSRRSSIRGVCPRGLIEAAATRFPSSKPLRHPRGLPPRPH